MDDLNSALVTLRDGDFQARWEIAKAFSVFGERAVSSLLPLLKDENTDAELTWFLVKILGRFQSSEVTLALIDLLSPDLSEDVSGLVAQTLAGMGVPALKSLEPLLSDPTRQLQALRAVALSDHPTAVPLLLRAWSQSVSPGQRELVLEALDKFQHPALIDIFLQGLKDDSAGVRKAAVLGLTAYRSVGSQDGYVAYARDNLVSYLLPCLSDCSVLVVEQAVRSLGLLATEQAVAALVVKCCEQETSPELQRTIILALGWADSSSALAGLTQIWQSLSQSPMPSELLLKEVLISLSRTTCRSEAAEMILKLLKTPALQKSVSLKSAAAHSLGRLEDEASIKGLIDLLADADYALQLQVVAALKQISPHQSYQALQRRASDSSTSAELSAGLAVALQEWRK